MKLKRFAGLGFAALAVAALTACKELTPTEKNASYSEAAGTSAEKDLEIYEEVLGDFEAAYAAAKQASSDSERYAKMALAEAELLKAAVFLPTTTQGGNYALTAVAPHTVPFALWGTDEYRFKDLVVANTKITAAHRTAMMDSWTTNKGTEGYDHIAYVEKFLADNGYTQKDTYTTTFTEGTETFDWLATSMASDSEILVNLVDGLVEYNGEGELVPALAESWEKGTDAEGNTTYTFKIRDGIKWVDASTGIETEYEVTAHDFVTGFQHMLDAAGGLEYLVEGVIVNASEYLYGEVTDFAQVGVKATDDNTLVYTLCDDISYFLTYLSYNIFQPMNKAYFESKGGALGMAEFAAASETAAYTYGTSKETVLSCGAYYLSEYADNSSVVFKANASYWNAANVNIKEIKWLYNDGADLLKGYNWFKDGTIDAVGLNTSAIAQAKADGLFDTYSYCVDTTATTYFAGYNLNRQTFVLSNGAIDTAKTEKEAALTAKAMLNQNFRLALSHAFNKGNWNAQSVGDDLKLNSLRNTYTPYGFVSLTEAVTVNGKTYPAGTQYGAILQDACTALGLKVDVKDGVDGWYNVEEAQKYIEAAVEELNADGANISSDNKVIIDIFYYSASQTQTNQAQSYKQSVEAAIGDYVQVNLVEATTTDDYYAAGYRAANGAAGNYDVFYGSGWGPDYGDPSTYLDTFLGEGAGYMTKVIGLW